MYARHYGTAGVPQTHPRPRAPRAAPPRKGTCPHCHNAVTPGRGSPMHAMQQAPPPAPPPAALMAMQQAGAQGPPPGGGPPPTGPGGM